MLRGVKYVNFNLVTRMYLHSRMFTTPTTHGCTLHPRMYTTPTTHGCTRHPPSMDVHYTHRPRKYTTPTTHGCTLHLPPMDVHYTHGIHYIHHPRMYTTPTTHGCTLPFGIGRDFHSQILAVASRAGVGNIWQWKWRAYRSSLRHLAVNFVNQNYPSISGMSYIKWIIKEPDK
jgi:hypothetical protein